MDRKKVIAKLAEEIRLGEHWDKTYRSIDMVLLRDIDSLLKQQEAELLQQEAELDILRNLYKQDSQSKQEVKWE